MPTAQDDASLSLDVLRDGVQILCAFMLCLVVGLLTGGVLGGAIGLLAGLAAGYAVAILQDWRDMRRQRVQTPAQGRPITHPASDR